MVDQILQQLAKHGYFHQEEFLSTTELREINAFFDTHKQEFIPAKVGHKDQKHRVETIRGDFTYWLDPVNPQGPFIFVFNFLQSLLIEVNRSLYLGIRDFECHLAYYPPGTYYQKHLDRFENEGSRRLSFIFYLNEEWQPDNGGELVLYSKDEDVLQKIYPLPGSFVCFLSDEFPHEVKRGDKERRSLTGWMHNKILY